MLTRKAKPVYFLPQEKLPSGFKYPEAYKQVVASKPYCIGPVNEDWCFIDEEDLEWFLEEARKIAPSLSLVPFMRRNGEDGVACFDGSSRDGNPMIYVFNYCVEIGVRETRLKFPEWLALIPPADEDDEA